MDAKKLINLLNDANHSARTYSGRGMFGKECVGVTLDRNTPESEFIADVIEVIADNEEWDTLREFCSLLRDSRGDSMGLGSIIYWPQIEWPDDMETGKYHADLKGMLENYDRKGALKLCDRLHAAEENDYELTDEEDTLWGQLTDRIESENQS